MCGPKFGSIIIGCVRGRRNSELGLLRFHKRYVDPLFYVLMMIIIGFDVGKNHRNQSCINMYSFGTFLVKIRVLWGWFGRGSRKKSRRENRVLNPASVRRLKAAGLGAGLNFLCSIRARKAAGLNSRPPA